MSLADPLLDNWYQDAESNRSFRVVAIDADNDSIEVQFLNGDIGEFETVAWEDSAFYPIEPPEDWSTAYDQIELDDLGYTDTDDHTRDRGNLCLDDILDEENDSL